MAKNDSSRGGQTTIDKSDLPKAKLSIANLKKSMRLFSYLGKHRWKFGLGLVFLGASAGVGLIFPLKSGEMLGLIGESVKTQSEIRTELTEVGLALLGILLAQAIFSFG